MPHQIYKTDGIILGSEPAGEASRRLWILTPDLGLVVASAQGLRKITSKLRYHLQDFSLARINLVRGRETWRMTGAQVQRNFARAAAPASYHIITNIARLLCRLCPGEESNPELFEDARRGLALIQALPPRALPSAEALVVLRVLHRLGYVGERPELVSLLRQPIRDTLLKEIAPRQRAAVSAINQALRASHL